MGLDVATWLKVAFEKSVFRISGYERTPLLSLWYLTDPSKCVTQHPAFRYENLADVMDSVGMMALYADIEADTGVLYPDNDTRKANGRPASQIIAKLDPTTRLAILSFIGERHELHAVFKRPAQNALWQLDSFSIEENGRFFTLECGTNSESLPFVRRGLAAFDVVVAITLFDPQSREQDADIELGKMLKDDLDALYARFQNTPPAFAPR